jgi:CRISPR-associated protein Cmr6
MRQAIKNLAARRDRAQHPGLLLQRYLAEPAAGEDGNHEEKRSLLYAVIAAAANADLRKLYDAAFRRWESAFPELTAANDFRTDARLIVGLGSENVLETGIRLHHTYGLPIISGSALKGLASHYCNEVWGQPADDAAASDENKRWRRGWTEEKHQYHRLLFGTTDDSGCVVFNDAWLTLDSADPLVMDVMTPHHPQWLDGARPPTDFDSPVPVPFVSIMGSFRIAISWHGPLSPKAACWTELALDLLAEALRHRGVGGKTSSGYGRLSEVDTRQRRKPFSAEALGLPAIGTLVTATLLDAPKRGKPWRATVLLHNGRELAGPIEPIERNPTDATARKSVRLVVAHVNEKSIRFTWAS